MMPSLRRRRLAQLLWALFVLSIVVGLVLYALRQNISLFYSPTELVVQHAPLHHTLRMGGLVSEGSLVHGNALQVRFIVTDRHTDIPVSYTGVLPDLFREGKSTVVEGEWTGRVFKAHTVLAKHDENYMPRAVQQALIQSPRQLPTRGVS